MNTISWNASRLKLYSCDIYNIFEKIDCELILGNEFLKTFEPITNFLLHYINYFNTSVHKKFSCILYISFNKQVFDMGFGLNIKVFIVKSNYSDSSLKKKNGKINYLNKDYIKV